MRTTGTVIVGAGQAGLALSRHLTRAGHDHVVVERGRVAERWRSERWDSLTLLTPNWLNALPGSDPHPSPDGYLTGAEFARYLVSYAASFGAPVVESADVRSVRRTRGALLVRTTAGTWAARNVVVASGDCDRPHVPHVPGTLPDWVDAFHASRYRNPEQPAPGGVLVVGAGPSGQQLALELARAGRAVTLAVGSHTRMVRRYRGRDVFGWAALLGDLDQPVDDVEPAAAQAMRAFALTGARGGEEIGLDVLAAHGVVLAGRLVGLERGAARVAPDLQGSVEDSERRLRRFLARIDAFAGEPHEEVPPVAVPQGPDRVDLRHVSTVIWATGYRRAYPWLHLPVLDGRGEIVQRHGVTAVPGVFTLGMRFQRRRASHLIGGVGADAAALAEAILVRERARGRSLRPARALVQGL